MKIAELQHGDSNIANYAQPHLSNQVSAEPRQIKLQSSHVRPTYKNVVPETQICADEREYDLHTSCSNLSTVDNSMKSRKKKRKIQPFRGGLVSIMRCDTAMFAFILVSHAF